MKESEPYPDWKTYNIMYHKYLWSRDPAELFDIALEKPNAHSNVDNCLSGKVVLDICSGSGRLAASAIAHGAKRVLVVEKEFNMINPHNLKSFDLGVYQQIKHRIETEENVQKVIFNNEQLCVYNGEAEFSFWNNEIKCQFDFAFCQQAINIWLNEDSVYDLAQGTKPGAVLVFSTFNHKPDRKPKVTEYYTAGKNYTEVSYLIDTPNGESVEHVQICEGYSPHYTNFRWIAPEEYDIILSPYFNVQRIRDGKTDFYRCTRLHNYVT